jgi:hypothetical protein
MSPGAPHRTRIRRRFGRVVQRDHDSQILRATVRDPPRAVHARSLVAGRAAIRTGTARRDRGWGARGTRTRMMPARPVRCMHHRPQLGRSSRRSKGEKGSEEEREQSCRNFPETAGQRTFANLRSVPRQAKAPVRTYGRVTSSRRTPQLSVLTCPNGTIPCLRIHGLMLHDHGDESWLSLKQLPVGWRVPRPQEARPGRG